MKIVKIKCLIIKIFPLMILTKNKVIMIIKILLTKIQIKKKSRKKLKLS
jgi:hypothetical protein